MGLGEGRSIFCITAQLSTLLQAFSAGSQESSCASTVQLCARIQSESHGYLWGPSLYSFFCFRALLHHCQPKLQYLTSQLTNTSTLWVPAPCTISGRIPVLSSGLLLFRLSPGSVSCAVAQSLKRVDIYFVSFVVSFH